MIQILSNIRPDSTFLSLKKYRNANNEVADYQIIFHASYENAIKRSISFLEGYQVDGDIENQAKSELLASFHATLSKGEDEVAGVYERVFGDNGKPIKGVKVHKENGTAYIFGMLHNKFVYQAGIYKPVNKANLTMAKDRLRKMVPVSRFRQFIVKPGSCEEIKVENLSFLP